MAMSRSLLVCISLIVMLQYSLATSSGFVKVNGSEFELDGNKYYYLGTNYWYGMNLGAPKSGNRTRLTKELDDLVSIGVRNLRIMGSTQGPDNRSRRIVPSLEPKPDEYNDDIWIGLDFFLAEMAKRDMKAIVTLSNFWEWSGGFGQIHEWYQGEFTGYPTQFYYQKNMTDHLNRFIKRIITRKNTVTNKVYRDDPTIMAWQLANEPRAGSCNFWTEWVNKASHYIKSLDSNHLVSIGNEGTITGCSRDGNELDVVDYVTFHAWAQNWGWFTPTSMTKLENGIKRFDDYVLKNVNPDLNKPHVLEEFGLGRDQMSYDPKSKTEIKDEYYKHVFQTVYDYAHDSHTMSGVNFWAYGGKGRPKNNGGEYWKAGDDFIGDPPHERQGWYSVYDTDYSTKEVIKSFAAKFDSLNVPA